jgi:hypothetical protein
MGPWPALLGNRLLILIAEQRQRAGTAIAQSE